MPKASLPDAVRYFASPFVMIAFLAIYNYDFITKTQTDFSYLGAAATLVAGIIVYFLYRYLFFHLLMWAHDLLGIQNYRNLIKSRYDLSARQKSFTATIIADKIAVHFFQDSARSERQHLLASATHLFYQVFIIAIGFTFAALWHMDGFRVMIFVALGMACGVVGFRLNNDVEDQELVKMKAQLGRLDAVALSLGFQKRAGN